MDATAIGVRLDLEQRRSAVRAWRGRIAGKAMSRGNMFALFFFYSLLLVTDAGILVNIVRAHPAFYPFVVTVVGLLVLAVLVVGYLMRAGIILYPAVPAEVVITPVEGGLLTETPLRRKLLPWSNIRAAFDVSGWILIQRGFSVIAVPKSCDPDGRLWALLRERLVGKKMLVPGSDARNSIFNTAR